MPMAAEEIETMIKAAIPDADAYFRHLDVALEEACPIESAVLRHGINSVRQRLTTIGLSSNPDV